MVREIAFKEGWPLYTCKFYQTGFIFLVKLNSPQIQESVDFNCNQKRKILKPKQDPPGIQKGTHQINT